MILIVLALVFAGFTGAIASSKNRSFMGWFILGGCFNLIALLAVGLMPRIEMVEEEPEERGPVQDSAFGTFALMAGGACSLATVWFVFFV